MSGGVIEAIGPDLDAAGADVVDGGGLLALPGMIDGHVHLDKTLTGCRGSHTRPNPAAPAASPPNANCGHASRLPPSGPRTWCARPSPPAPPPSAVMPTSAPTSGVRHVEALLEVKAAFAHAADFQIVAFPQYGVLAAPGTFELMDEALAMGADLVGGIDPIVQDGDLDGQLDLLFGLAEKHGVGIDPHIHEPDESGVREIEALAERARVAGLQGRVTVSHGFCLGACPDDVFERLAGAMAEAGMSLVTNAAGANPLPPVKKLRARGVEVFIGNDDVRDTWSPYSDGDLLVRAMLLSWRSGYRADADLGVAFDCATAAARRVFGHDDRGIAVGAPADLFTVHAETLGEAGRPAPAPGAGVQGRPPRGKRRRIPRVTDDPLARWEEARARLASTDTQRPSGDIALPASLRRWSGSTGAPVARDRPR